MNDKEKIEQALSKITKLINRRNKLKVDDDDIADSEDHIESLNKIKNKLSDTTTSDVVKVNEALTEIYRQIFEYAVIQDSSYFHLRAIKKVKSILGQIPAKEEELRDFYIGMRDER